MGGRAVLWSGRSRCPPAGIVAEVAGRALALPLGQDSEARVLTGSQHCPVGLRTSRPPWELTHDKPFMGVSAPDSLLYSLTGSAPGATQPEIFVFWKLPPLPTDSPAQSCSWKGIKINSGALEKAIEIRFYKYIFTGVLVCLG